MKDLDDLMWGVLDEHRDDVVIHLSPEKYDELGLKRYRGFPVVRMDSRQSLASSLEGIREELAKMNKRETFRTQEEVKDRIRLGSEDVLVAFQNEPNVADELSPKAMEQVFELVSRVVNDNRPGSHIKQFDPHQKYEKYDAVFYNDTLYTMESENYAVGSYPDICTQYWKSLAAV